MNQICQALVIYFKRTFAVKHTGAGCGTGVCLRGKPKPEYHFPNTAGAPIMRLYEVHIRAQWIDVNMRKRGCDRSLPRWQLLPFATGGTQREAQGLVMTL